MSMLSDWQETLDMFQNPVNALAAYYIGSILTKLNLTND